jgi:electron transfer flavoprotein beta subunit
MRIAVCIKQVPETKSVKMDEKTGTVIRKGVQSIVNPLDLYAIEAALNLKEQHGAETIAVTMGPPQAEEALREAVAMGLDKAVLLSDRAYAGSDTWATAFILAEALKKLGDFDLILCGERATDGDTGQVGPEIAASLEMPVASYVNRIFEIENERCRLSRLVEGGSEELSMQLPGVVTVVKEIGDPRLPTLRGKLKAKALEVPVFTQKELECDTNMIGLNGSPTRVVKIFRPKVARQCQLVTAEDESRVEQAIDTMMEFLSSREVVS